jgi:hypothetical protein
MAGAVIQAAAVMLLVVMTQVTVEVLLLLLAAVMVVVIVAVVLASGFAWHHPLSHYCTPLLGPSLSLSPSLSSYVRCW